MSLGFTELYEISEPFGFDAANFVIKQNEERFSRDIIFGNASENEVYHKGHVGERRDTEQVTSPSGTTSFYLDMGFEWIMETINRFGFEGEIERILEKDGVQFTIGLLDLPTRDTDGYSYIGCNVIQNTKVSNYKKQLESTIDMFSTKNFRNETITPAPTLKFLRRAVPVSYESQWGKTGLNYLHNFSSAHYFCFNEAILKSGISNTFASVADVMRWSSGFPGDGWRWYTQAQLEAGGYAYTEGNNGGAMRLLKASKHLVGSSMRIKFKGSIMQREASPETMYFTYLLMTNNGDFKGGLDSGDYHQAFTIPLEYNVSIPIDVDIEYTFPFDIAQGNYLFGCFTALMPTELYLAVPCDLHIDQVDIQMFTSELAFDTVQSGVRYIDMIKQCSKFINDLPIDADIYDVGGEHYDNVCFNRALLSIKTSNSLALEGDTLPEGNLGDVITNTDATYLPLGMYFWNGTQWINLSTHVINNVSLISNVYPVGSVGDVIFNTNTSVYPNGLCYWNGDAWIGLEYSRPFVTTTKDCLENAMTLENCADYEILQERIFVGKYNDYYTNNELDAFLIEPSRDFKQYDNERFKVNNFKLGYDTYETFRLSKSTANDIHTTSEWFPPNIYVENKFDRSIKYIRSGYSAQAMVDLEIKTPQTAYENDDKVFIVKLVPLPNDTQFNESVTLNMSVVNGQLIIANRDSNTPDDAVSINWNMLGLTIGQNFSIASGENNGDYIVSSFTSSLLTLTPMSGTNPTFNGDSFIQIKFNYIGVNYQTKTHEGYNIVNNLENPYKYPNLDYTIRRNMINWENYIASMCLFHQDKKVKNLFFKNNPPLVTQQATTDPIYTEKADIEISSLPIPILSTQIYDFEIFADFQRVLDLMSNIKEDRGFIRCLHISGRIIKGYIKELDYTWKSGSLKLKLEEKFEPQIITLIYNGTTLEVNDTAYDLGGNLDWWKISGEYFQCFDKNNLPLCNTTHYSNISLNGTVYGSVDLLINALILLL